MSVIRTFGGFELHEKIGSGGMATVYRGVQKSLDRAVVLKILHPHLAEDQSLVVRFEREARAAANLRHENIVQVIDCGREEDTSYIAMEFVEGMDLQRLMRDHGPPPLPIAVLLLRDVCRGLEHAHQHRVIHRDIKPANLMLTKDGTLKIMDFGLARRGEDSVGMTATGAVLGTPAYMSPEQAMGQHVDARSDVFSVGVVGYEMLGGQRPFPGDSYATVLSAIVGLDPRPLNETNPAVPAEVVALIHRMLEKDPNRRYQSISEVRDELETMAEYMGLLRGKDLLRAYASDPEGAADALSRSRVPGAGGTHQTTSRGPVGGATATATGPPGGPGAETVARTPAGGSEQTVVRTPAGGSEQVVMGTPAGGSEQVVTRTPAGRSGVAATPPGVETGEAAAAGDGTGRVDSMAGRTQTSDAATRTIVEPRPVKPWWKLPLWVPVAGGAAVILLVVFLVLVLPRMNSGGSGDHGGDLVKTGGDRHSGQSTGTAGSGEGTKTSTGGGTETSSGGSGATGAGGTGASGDETADKTGAGGTGAADKTGGGQGSSGRTGASGRETGGRTGGSGRETGGGTGTGGREGGDRTGAGRRYQISSRPFAYIYVDGSSRPANPDGRPAVLTLKPGRHTFRAVNDRLTPPLSVTFSYDVKAGDPNNSLILNLESRNVEPRVNRTLPF